MSISRDKGKYLYSTSCDCCGSSDARAIYDNDTYYCFKCGDYGRTDGKDDQPGRRRRVEGLINSGWIKALEKRKITEETCQKFNYQFGIHQGQNVQIANYYKNGNIVAQHLRTAGKEFSWMGDSKNMELFGQHLWRNTGGKRIVITEGEIDCMSVSQVFNLRWPVVSVPNGAQSAKKYLSQQLEFLETFEEIVIAFDNDEPGREAAEECAALFTPGKVKIASFAPYKDANEMLQADKGKDIAEAVFAAKVYRPDGIIEGGELSLEELLKEEDLFCFDTPYPELNKMLRGLRKAELTTITAGSGIGKSTLARELAYYLMTFHHLKIGYIALEEAVKKSALRMMAIDLNVPLGELFLNRKLVPAEDFEKSYSRTVANDRLFLYDHFGSLESSNLIAKMKFLALGCGVDFIVLDHVSIVVSGIEVGEERRIIDNLMTALRSLVENTGVGMLLISHLKVPDKTPHEEGGRVTLNQLRGSGSIKQLSDNIIGLERNQQSDTPDIALVRILKNRLFGSTGLADVLQYDKETGRLLPKEDTGDPFETSEAQLEDPHDLPF